MFPILVRAEKLPILVQINFYDYFCLLEWRWQGSTADVFLSDACGEVLINH